MKKCFNTAIITLSMYTFSVMAGVDATKIPFVKSDMNVCDLQPTEVELQSVIQKRLKNIKNNKIEDQETYTLTLANKLLDVSQCFEIDPVVFSGLIGHESFFNQKSVSPTGAIGLGQLTSVALKEIAQQLQAPQIKEKDKGTDDALEYWKSAIYCVENGLNDGEAINHWWNFKRPNRIQELHDNMVLNLTYSAMIFKIAQSKAIAYFNNYKRGSSTINQMLKLTLGYYNGSTEDEKLAHYNGTRVIMNQILATMDAKDNNCYLPNNK